MRFETKKKVVSYNWVSKDSPLLVFGKVVLYTATFATLLWLYYYVENNPLRVVISVFLFFVLMEGINVRHKATENFKEALAITEKRERRMASRRVTDIRAK